eukprot:COSAG02_NODE_2800_length_8006_cov_3.868092_3_plen_690_part_00
MKQLAGQIDSMVGGAQGRPTSPAESFAGATADWVLIRAKIRRIYRYHRPEKLAEVDELLVEWAGEEQELLAKIVEKYGAQQTQQLEVAKLKVVNRHVAKRKLRRGYHVRETAADKVRKRPSVADAAALRIQRVVRGRLGRSRARLRSEAAAAVAADAAEAATDTAATIDKVTPEVPELGLADPLDLTDRVVSIKDESKGSFGEVDERQTRTETNGDEMPSARSVQSDASTAVSSQTASGGEDVEAGITPRSDVSTAVSAQTQSDHDDTDAAQNVISLQAETDGTDIESVDTRPTSRGFAAIQQLRKELPAVRGELTTPEDAQQRSKEKRRRRRGHKDEDENNKITLKIVNADHLHSKRERRYRKAERITKRVMVARIEIAWRIKVATRLRSSHKAATELQRFVRGWHARKWIAQRLAATVIQYYVRRHLRDVTNRRLNKVRDGVVLLQNRWLDRQRKRVSTLRRLAGDAAAAGRWRTQKLIAMKNAGACGIEAAALGVIWAERKAEETWQARYRSLQQLNFDEARRHGAEMQRAWALDVVRKSVRRRVSKKRLFQTIGRRQLKKMDTMSGLLLQSITDVLVDGEEGSIASNSEMPVGLESQPNSNSILRTQSSSLSLPPVEAAMSSRRQRRGYSQARRRGGRQARATPGMSAGYVPRREMVGRGGTQLAAISTGVGIHRDRAALQLRSS